MPRLSLTNSKIKASYTVVVVGSGYGGAIAASRLARAGQQVCVLERGRELQPGEYPDTEDEVLAEVQAQLPDGHIGSRAGLYDFHVNPDVNVFVGCGLGGTSLINGNVAVRPGRRLFEDARWPRALRDGAKSLEDGFLRAEEMLRPVPYPARYPNLAKLEALERSAAHLGEHCSRVPITVSFTEGINAVGVAQRACILCGDCITGCNYGAKNTVLFNYLPDARNFGAEIYTGVSVRCVEHKDGRWLAHYQILETGLEDSAAPLRSVAADILVLAAGTLGSTEILLRSKAAGLPLSSQIGQHFSGNGDFLGFSAGCATEIRGVGYGHRDPRDMEAVGPAVTGMIEVAGTSEEDSFVIHEIATPGALSGLLPVALANAASALGRDTVEQAMAAEESEIESLFTGPYETLANETQAYLVTTQEQRSGTMRLEHDRLRIEWPQAGDQPIFQQISGTLAEATRALGGKYLENPVWSSVFNHDLITLHPLGGCAMADDSTQGAVNHKGQVYSDVTGTSVHEGLYVLDGSTIPRSLGVGPLLTISALSERACAMMAQDRGWNIDYALPSRPTKVDDRVPLRVQFSEKARCDSLELDLTVVCEDLEELLRNPDSEARVAGRVVAAHLSADALIANGGFSLGRQTYRLLLTGETGADYHLDISREAAVLRATAYRGSRESAPVLLEAVLRIAPQDLRRQLSTIRVFNAEHARERLEYTLRFGRALAGDLYDVYGSVAPGRKKRPLRLNAPTLHSLASADGKHHRVMRYEGGSRGPVLLAPGAGVSSMVFAIDTIETNLLEFLFAHSFDVWLLDSADGRDREAAVVKIKEITRAAGVRVLTAGWEASAPVELNAATRDALPEEWHGITIVGKNAARDVFPDILSQLTAGAAVQ
ncbi:MAG: GMC family oxidoreductase N-terminal domain-containing protein [Bryobacteraceae bacterium]|jgi:cholesterol oxidase